MTEAKTNRAWEALKKRGALGAVGLAQAAEVQAVQLTPKNINTLVAEYTERGGSIPLLADLAEVSASHLRKIAAQQRQVSASTRNRILSAILEIEPHIGNGLVLDTSAEIPETKKRGQR